jgi:hypothetical protein
VNGERARLAEVLAALSLATDLGAAWPPETALKTCLVGVGLARRVGLGEPDVGDVYYLALLRSVACTAFAHEMAVAWGDDIGLRRLMDPLDKADPDAWSRPPGPSSRARTASRAPGRRHTCSRPPGRRWPTRCASPTATSAGASPPGWG